MKKTVVLYPGFVISHFTPMMQLADVLQEEGYGVVVALIDVTMEHNTAFAAAVGRVMASSKPPAAVTFHTLPRIQDPPTITNDVNLLIGYFETIRRYNEHLRELLCSIPPRSIHAVIVDSLSNAALDVTDQLGIPACSFFTSNASALAVFLQFPWARRAEGQLSFKELGDADATINFHGVPPIPASHLVREVLENPKTEIYMAVMNSLGKNLEAAGILVNTFASLEARAVAALKEPHFLAGSGLTVPPVYCVGPLVEDAAGRTKERHECLTWLDEQPEHSVVFLCFGSIGAGIHSEEQLKEIAVGLERSGHRFLWVVRASLGDNPEREFGNKADPNLHALLPEGFLERTKGHGLVVKLWAPQVEVLRHRATSRVAAWACQGEELEAKVRLVMESVEGEQLRARVTAHKEAAHMVWKDGGSSREEFSQFLSNVGKG